MKQNPKFEKFIANMFIEVDMSISDICLRTGVSRSTYYRWLKDHNFCQALERGRREFIKAHLREVDSAILQKAKAGNVQAARLVYEHFDSLLRSAETEERVIIIEDKTPATDERYRDRKKLQALLNPSKVT